MDRLASLFSKSSRVSPEGVTPPPGLFARMALAWKRRTSPSGTTQPEGARHLPATGAVAGDAQARRATTDVFVNSIAPFLEPRDLAAFAQADHDNREVVSEVEKFKFGRQVAEMEAMWEQHEVNRAPTTNAKAQAFRVALNEEWSTIIKNRHAPGRVDEGYDSLMVVEQAIEILKTGNVADLPYAKIFGVLERNNWDSSYFLRWLTDPEARKPRDGDFRELEILKHLVLHAAMSQIHHLPPPKELTLGGRPDVVRYLGDAPDADPPAPLVPEMIKGKRPKVIYPWYPYKDSFRCAEVEVDDERPYRIMYVQKLNRPAE